MKTKVLSFFLALIVLVSCSNNEKMSVINVNVDANDVEMVNDNLTIKTMLPLKYNDLIGEIRKLVCYENNYYLLDSNTQKILCFDNKGELVFEISSVGRGPEEYTGIQNFYINHINKYVELI